MIYFLVARAGKRGEKWFDIEVVVVVLVLVVVLVGTCFFLDLACGARNGSDWGHCAPASFHLLV